MATHTDEEFPTIIGADAVFKGELRFEKGVKHLGRFEGQIESKGHLVVAEGAHLSGEVSAGSVNVQGEVKGNLKASGKVRLAATAKLEGDLHTARLEVSEGAVFVGRCVVGPNGRRKPADAARPTDTARPAAPPVKVRSEPVGSGAKK